ncbi:MAG: hypothetical protein JWQ63_1021 [Mucilaginibacter sp.]|nr:hypothetical protein [Mucilaginibacter sp.]
MMEPFNGSEYQRLLYEIPAPLYIFDSTSYQMLEVNSVALEQYGYTRDEFLSLNAINIRPSEEHEAFYQINKLLPETHFDVGRFVHKRKNGELFYVHIYSHGTCFQGRKAKLVMAIDIDKKVQAEKAVKEKTDEIENILESITDGFYAVNREWEITYFNKEAERILCQKREDVLGKNIWKYFPRSLEGKFFSEYNRVMKERISIHFEEYYAPVDTWGSMYVYPTKDGIAVYFVDITGQKRIQEKLIREEHNLRALINNTHDLIWSVDCKFNIITGNQAFWERVELLTGKTEQNITNTDFEQGMMKPILDSYNLAFKGEAFRIVRQREIEGELRFEELSFNPIYDQQHHVIGVNCFLRDITEQQQYLEQIKQQNAKLLEIAWIQSHKVRAPVANLLGLAHLLESDPDPVIIEKIKEVALHMDEIIREITAQTAGVDRKK